MKIIVTLLDYLLRPNVRLYSIGFFRMNLKQITANVYLRTLVNDLKFLSDYTTKQ